MEARKSEPTTSTSPASPDWPAWITLAALAIGLVIVAVRLTILEVVRENYELGGAPISLIAAGPGPTTTLIFDLICWLPAVLILIRRAVDPQYTLRLYWSHLPMALLAAWIAISCFWASDKFAAVITASTWCAAMSLGWAFSQLIRSWARFRLIGALVLGLLMVFIAHAAIYRFSDWPAMVAMLDQMRAAYSNAPGEHDFLDRQLDLGVRNGAMIGFFRSPNTFAAVIAMGVLTTIGLAIQRWRDRDDPGFPIVIGLPALASLGVLYLTGSRTAMAGLVLCAIVLAVAWRKREMLSQHGKSIFFAVLSGIVVAGAVVITIGVFSGRLLHESLTFRWNYWQGAWTMVKSHPIVGVGWSNFGNSYLAHRLPMAAEEIKDPHNFVVRFLTETGIVGALLALAWFGRTAWEATRPVLPRSSTASTTLPLKLIGTVAAGYFVLRMIALQPLSLFWPEPLKMLLFAVLLAFGIIVGIARSAKNLDADDRPAPLLLMGTLLAIAGFWLHATVDFALFETGPLLVMMTIIGAILGIRHPGAAGQKPRTMLALVALGSICLGLITFTALIVIPTASAEAQANRGMEMASKEEFASAGIELRQAFFTSPVYNSDYATRAARMMYTSGSAAPNDILGMLSLAITADPANPAVWRDRARHFSTTKETDAAVSDYHQFFGRNPNDVPTRLEFATFLAASGKSDDAVKEYRAALDVNNKLDPNEPRRLTTKRVAEIEIQIQELSAQ